MKKIPKKLSVKVADELRHAVDLSGHYDPKECLFIIEEGLTLHQAYQAHAFLAWCFAENKKFGANIQDVYADFYKDGQPYYDAVLKEAEAPTPSDFVGTGFGKIVSLD